MKASGWRHRVVGDRTGSRAVHVKQGDLWDGRRMVFMRFWRRRAMSVLQESEPPYERGSACNGRGAKGGRKVDGVNGTGQAIASVAVPAWVSPTEDLGAEWRRREAQPYQQRLLTAHNGVRKKALRRSSSPTEGRTPQPQPSAFGSSTLLEVNHQLESRMREIRTSGSEGGGARERSPYPYQSGGFAAAMRMR